MRCRQAEKLIFDFIDGAISEADRVGLERHLTECGACEAMATGLSKSLDLLHRVPIAEPSDNFNWKLRLRLAKEKNAWKDGVALERAWQKSWNLRFATGALSTFVVVLVAGLIALKAVGGAGDKRVPIEWRPQSNPKGSPVARDEAAKDRSSAYEFFAVPRSAGGGSQPVSAITGRNGGPETGLQGTWGPILNVDSLKVRYVETMSERQRLHQLEQQIEVLHKELEKCNLERR